jgi:hypothetical protein
METTSNGMLNLDIHSAGFSLRMLIDLVLNQTGVSIFRQKSVRTLPDVSAARRAATDAA